MHDIAAKAFATTQPLTLAVLRCAAELPIKSGVTMTAEEVAKFAHFTAVNYLNRQRSRGLLTKHPTEPHAYFLNGMPEFG